MLFTSVTSKNALIEDFSSNPGPPNPISLSLSRCNWPHWIPTGVNHLLVNTYTQAGGAGFIEIFVP